MTKLNVSSLDWSELFDCVGLDLRYWNRYRPSFNYNKKQDCLSRVVMVTHEKRQILNCNIQFYLK